MFTTTFIASAGFPEALGLSHPHLCQRHPVITPRTTAASSPAPLPALQKPSPQLYPIPCPLPGAQALRSCSWGSSEQPLGTQPSPPGWPASSMEPSLSLGGRAELRSPPPGGPCLQAQEVLLSIALLQ